MKNKGFFHEFREFAMRGNVIDLAVGVLIGGAFSTITTSLVNDLLMPLVGLFVGGVDFSSWTVTLGPLFPGTQAAELHPGIFIQSVINFLILALVIFLMVRSINRLRERAAARHGDKEEEPAAPAAPTETQLLQQILDEIRSSGNQNIPS